MTSQQSDWHLMAGQSPFRKDVEVIRVVRTTLLKRGKGTEDDPVRRIEQFWALDGELLAENDPCAEEAA